MVKKRLIGVVVVKDGWAVQSFGYNRYLPIGKPECLVENLDRWGADEILVQVVDRSNQNLGPSLDLIERLGALGLSTPLIYGGGIKTVIDGIEVIKRGADRILLDSLLFGDASIIQDLSQSLGCQAIIASLPLRYNNGLLKRFSYINKELVEFDRHVIDLFQNGIVSEALIVDYENEGYENSFNINLVEMLSLNNVPLIAFGGISHIKQIEYLLTKESIAAIAIGNFLNYSEHAVQTYKKSIHLNCVRSPIYQSQESVV